MWLLWSKEFEFNRGIFLCRDLMAIEKQFYRIFSDFVCLKTTFLSVKSAKNVVFCNFSAEIRYAFPKTYRTRCNKYIWQVLRDLGVSCPFKIIIKTVMVAQENNLVYKIPVCKTHLQVTFTKHFLQKLRTMCSSLL